MAFKGTAGKSSSGASMSKYDVEVESRLQALEKGLADCKAQCAANSHSHAASSGGADPRVDKIIAHMAKNEDVSDIS
tara:strand:- start:3137 stop:3367 length:231 start_codon:yes stop_codon:yes gene_type:complete